MKNTEALRLLGEAGRPVLRTRDAAALLGLSVTATSRKLRRLADDGLIGSLSHGLWSSSPKPDPYVVASWLTDPLPSYVSLYTALRIHGIIQQIPRAIFVVSVGRTGTVRTTAGTFSVAPDRPEAVRWIHRRQGPEDRDSREGRIRHPLPRAGSERTVPRSAGSRTAVLLLVRRSAALVDPDHGRPSSRPRFVPHRADGSLSAAADRATTDTDVARSHLSCGEP